jgi:16S rRNA (guanine(966)-N(2))-methyltransferase RsmD
MEEKMRIITGIAKGRVILAPEGLDTRPTSDRVKEALFNIISKKVPASKVLDLFAGTGNLGLEALSRGAETCIFAEKNNSTYKILEKNVDNLGFGGNCELYKMDAIELLSNLGKRNKKYDIIFLDPPYSMGLVEKSIELINKQMLLAENGIIISEHDEGENVQGNLGNLINYRTEKYGRTKIYFWHREE